MNDDVQKSVDVESLYAEIMMAIGKHADRVYLAAAIGVLELIKGELMENHRMDSGQAWMDFQDKHENN